MSAPGYDPALDRLDVAIRMLVHLINGTMQVKGSAQWKLLASYGLDRKEHAGRLSDALLEIGSINTEDGIFELLRACPFLLPAAIEMLREYQEKYAISRQYHYRGAA
jgi:hypothetical protein